MTIPADKALAVGKLLHPEREWALLTTRRAVWLCPAGDGGIWTDYDHTTPAECWAMEKHIRKLGYAIHYEKVGEVWWASAVSVLNHFEFMPEHEAKGETQAEALVALVLAVGGEE